jgi:hypothetical protein
LYHALISQLFTREWDGTERTTGREFFPRIVDTCSDDDVDGKFDESEALPLLPVDAG